MTSSLAQKAGLKLFEKHLESYKPVDPLYETYTDSKGRQKRRKRELPPGLSKRDAAILKSVKRRAHYLDKGFSLCGLRFGWTFVIGIIPGAGDIADAALNYTLVLRKCQQADLPSWLMRKMLVNNVISAGVGVIPIAGDVILASFKANSRNAALLEEFLRVRGEEFLKAGAGGSAPNAAHVKPGAGRKDGERIPAPDARTDAVPAAQLTNEEKKAIEKKEEQKGAKGASAGVGPSMSSSSGWWKGKGKAKAQPERQGKFVEGVSQQ